jgi:hypothetical protein
VWYAFIIAQPATNINGVVPGTGLEPVQLSPRDFKSLVSTDFTTQAGGGPVGTRTPNQRIMSPLL